MSQKSTQRTKSKRRGDPWVSNNRVLNSNATKKGGGPSRNPNFDTDETKVLIQLWGDPKLQRTLIIAHKKHAVLCDLAAKMKQYGYHRSPEEISTRIKNLKCFYNRLNKEIESCNGTVPEPTWKHYAEMDAIMKRPIFSVRPNEVPLPSLKYQLEKAREEREERRRKTLEDGGALSESDDGLDELVALSNGNSASKLEIDDGIIPDVEVDINDEAFAAIASAAEKTVTPAKRRKSSKASEGSLELASDYEGEPDADMSNDGNDTDVTSELQIKEEENDSMDSNSNEFVDNNQETRLPTESFAKGKCDESSGKNTTKSGKAAKSDLNKTQSAALIIPKDEPIDVDAEFDNMCTTEPVTTTASIVTTSVNTQPTGTTTSTASKPSTPTQQGKISLVPTNFLMQPKPPAPTTPTIVQPPLVLPQPQQQIQLLPNTLTAQGALQPQRILLSGAPGTAGQGTTANAGFVATGPGGMKLLLVNADQATAGKMCATNTLTNCSVGTTLGTMVPLSSATTAALLQQQQQQQQHQQQQQQQQQLLKEQQQQQQQQQQKQQQQQQQQQEEQRLQRKQQKLAKAQAQRKQRQERDKLRREELLNRKENTGLRVLLRQLLNAQTENNEIQHHRLAVERERLDFERSAVDRFLEAMPKFFTQQQQQFQQQQQTFQQQQKVAMQAHAQQLRLNPPKLVFTTTSMPSAVGISGGATTAILTAPTQLTTATLPSTQQQQPLTAQVPLELPVCAPVSDVQLVTPKEERED